VSMMDNMKEWEKAWEKVDLFDKWKPKSARDHWHEKAFKAGWEAALEEFIKYTLAQQDAGIECLCDKMGISFGADDDHDNLQS